MRNKPFALVISTAAFLGLLALPPRVSAQQTWNGPNTTNNSIVGGTGIWSNDIHNWVDTGVEGPVGGQPYNENLDMLFSGAAGGTVTLGSNITTNEKSVVFSTNGYVINASNGFTLAGFSAITVDNGVTATIDAPLTDAPPPLEIDTATVNASLTSVSLTKAGAGTLNLSGVNTYTGITTINAGVLSISQDANLGTAPGAPVADQLTFDGGTLQATASFALNPNRGVTLNTGGGTFDVTGANVLTYDGIITGTGNLTKVGTGTFTLTGTNAYSGITTINAGALSISRDPNLGTAPGAPVADQLSFDGGTLQATATFTLNANRGVTLNATGGTFNVTDANVLTIAGVIAGPGSLTETGTGTLIISGVNTYTGITTTNAGVLSISQDANLGTAPGTPVVNQLTLDGGTLQTTGSFTLDPNRGVTLNTGGGTFDVTGANALTIAGVITGQGSLTKVGTGTLTLTGASANTYTGTTNINVGTLLVDGSLGARSVSVVSGATLGGKGTIGGAVTIQNGGILAPGDSLGTLTVGTLTLNSGSILNYQLGIPNVVGGGVNDLVNVNGNLTLAGTLNVNNVGGFGSGVYRLFNYTGSLTNDGLSLNTVPSGSTPADFVVQTAQHGQVNLVVSTSGFAIQFWDATITVADGIIHGGSGTWNNTTTNWTNAAATVNAPWQNGFAVFEGTAGTVTLGDNIRTTGMQFMSDGYTIVAPGAQALIGAPATTIRVDQGVSATISAPIVDGSSPAAITKTDLGTLILTGTNTYTGGTTIAAGMLQIGNGGTTGSIAGDVTDNGILAFDRNNVLTFGGVISGTGSVQQNGAGTTVLLLDNSYAGGTVINAGTLQLGNGGTTGSIVGNVTDNGILAFDRSNVFTFGGVISGTGGVQQNGAGTTVLLLDNSYAGGTIINAGTLQLGNGGTTGSLVGNVTDNGILAFDRSNVVTFGGVISGTGSVQQNGIGTTVLLLDNSYAGGTIINAGTLQLGNGGTTGSIVGNVTDNGILAFDRSNVLTFGGVISGTGSVQQNGIGTTLLVGGSTYTGGTTINAGALQLGNGGTTGAITGNVIDNSALIFDRSNLVSFLGAISGTGSVTQTGAGTTILAGDNTYAGGTTVDAGTLQAGSATGLSPNSEFTVNSILDLHGFNNTIGSLSGTGFVLNNGQVAAALTVGGDNASTSFSGVLENGTGILQFMKSGTGTLILTGANTYTGGTTINAGTLQIGNGGIIGSIAGNVVDDGTLAFDRSDSVTFPGVISGTGNLVKLGTGALTLPGTNTYTGTTTVNSGSLIVDGSIASAQTVVNSGGFLGGHGTIGGNLVNSGIVGPINSPGTLTVGGNYTQNAGGTLRIGVGGVEPAQHDLLAVNGHATLGGTLQLFSLGGFHLQPGEQVTFLTAKNGVSGAFNNTQNGLIDTGTIVQGQITSLANAVVLETTQGSFANTPGVATTPNELAVAKALDSARGDPREAALFAFLDSQPLANLPHDLNLIAPAQITSINATAVSVGNVQAYNVEQRLANIRRGSTGFSSAGFSLNGGTASIGDGFQGVSGPEGKSGPPVFAPTPDNRWGVFVTGLGEFTNVDGNTNAAGYDVNTGGFTLGVDYRVTPNFAVGLTGGYAHTSVGPDAGGNIDVNGGKLGLYATLFGNGFYLDAAVSGGPSSYNTRRTALQGTASGSTNGADVDALIAVGYDWTRGNLSIGPTASFQYGYIGLNSFSETGSLAPLKFPDQNTESERSAFGAKASYQWKVAKVTVIPQVSAAWQHEYGDTAYSIVSSFASGAGESFTVTGPNIGRDSLLIGAGATVIWNDRVSTYLFYDGEVARTNYQSHNVSGGVRISF